MVFFAGAAVVAGAEEGACEAAPEEAPSPEAQPQQSGAGYGGAGQGGRQTNAFHKKPIPFHLPPR